MSRRPPRFYFSFRSPYSWIAARLLEERIDPHEHSLEYVPSWNPGVRLLAGLEARGGRVAYAPMSREKHFYILQDIKRLTTKLGYRMAWPVDRDPQWDIPHLAYLAARRLGKGRQFFRLVQSYRWEEGGDICSEEALNRLADELQVAPDTFINAAADESILEEAADALYSAYRDGVFGVPFFIKGHEKFWGVDRLDDFVNALNASEALKM